MMAVYWISAVNILTDIDLRIVIVYDIGYNWWIVTIIILVLQKIEWDFFKPAAMLHRSFIFKSGQIEWIIRIQ